MNSLLENKLTELNNAKKLECWYIVKQSTDFITGCYLVSFLEEFKKSSVIDRLEDFISKKLAEMKLVKENITITDNHRTLRVAAYFGLITMTSSEYENAFITDTFEEIRNRCNGEFENTESYIDIIQRQIEKMFLSSSIDKEYEKKRKEYRLYPVMLLYKVLLELGRSDKGNYSISLTEYRYFVATTKVFEGFLDTLLLIKLLRGDGDAPAKFEEYRDKFDNRLILALKQLPSLIFVGKNISLKPEAISEVARKVYIFESNPDIFTTDKYFEFLASTKSLFELDELMELDEEIKKEIKKELKKTIVEKERIPNGKNILLYGVPGSGKSWIIEHEYCNPNSIVERLVFHPDYTNSDFIGQILPVVDDQKQVTYEFTAGPFTNILKDAYINPNQEYILIIEEINRGNAPAIFGEVFQLLDRKVTKLGEDDEPVGTSEYGITHKHMAGHIYDDNSHKVKIPSNLSIIATMNTSDQNVFTLDTAFQRRWHLRLIENNFDNVQTSFANAKILDTEVTWKKFCETINGFIVGNKAKMASAEDKRLGVYFVHKNELKFDDGAVHGEEYKTLLDEYNALLGDEREGTIIDEQKMRLKTIREATLNNRLFPEKVIKFLWDDAFKFDVQALFDITNRNSLEDIIREFVYVHKGKERYNIFKQHVRDALYSK